MRGKRKRLNRKKTVARKRRPPAKRPQKRTSKRSLSREQLGVLAKLQQAVAAWLLGITDRTLRDSIDAPRTPDGLYDAHLLVAWWIERTKRRLGGNLSTETERIKRARADALEYSNAVTRGRLVPVEEVQRDALAAGQAIRSKLDAVARSLGPEAQRLIDQAVEEFVKDLESAGAPGRRSGGAA